MGHCVVMVNGFSDKISNECQQSHRHSVIFMLNNSIHLYIGYTAALYHSSTANRMPNDDGEFYQFCYVSSSGQIRGASTPFQFQRPGSEDFVEVEDVEADIMVIRTKSVYLQENLQQAEAQKTKLKEVYLLFLIFFTG